MENITFSDILTEERASSKFTRELKAGLEQNGINIAARTIQAYVQGAAVPKYETAICILKILNKKMPEDDLMKILQNSRNELKSSQEGEMKKYLVPNYIQEKGEIWRAKVTFHNEDFTFLEGTGLSNEESIDLIKERISNLYGDDRQALTRYLCRLINEDMKKEIE